MSEKSKKAGANPCGLWIKVGPDIVPDITIRDLKQIYFTINGSDYEKNMHAIEIFGNEKDDQFRVNAAIISQQAKASGIASIYRGSYKVADELKTDGVLLEKPQDVKKARALLGEDAIIGLACGLENEQAAAAYDAGVDFVTFSTKKKKSVPDAEILKFWTILSDLPAVIEGPVTNDLCAYYVQAGAAFLDAGDYIFGHGKGVMQGTVNMLHAIDLAMQDMQERKAQ